MVTMIGDSSHQGRKPDAVSMAVRWGGTFLWGLLLTLHLGITPNGVLAQETGRPQRLIVIPSMTITGEYDNNIFQDPFDEVEDYSTIYSPGASVSYRWPHTVLSGNYVWNFQEYDDLEDLNNLDQSGGGSITHVFSPFLSFTSGIGYSISESEDVDLDLTVRGRLAESARERQSSESINADALIQLDYLTRLPITLTYAYADNLTSAADEVDELSHTFGANAFYVLVPGRGHRLNFDYTAEIREENRDTDRAPTDTDLNFAANNSTDHIATTSYTHQFDQSFNVTAGGGVSVVAHSSNPRQEGDVDPIFFAALTKRWVRTGVGLNWALDTGRDGGFEGTTTTQSVGLVADHTPHPNLALFLNVNFEDSSPENEATGLESDEQRFLVSPGVSYNFLRYFNLSGSYTYSRIEGDEGFVGSKFQEFTASLSITLRQDLPHFSVDYSHIENDSEVDLDDFDRDVLFFSVNYSLPFGL